MDNNVTLYCQYWGGGGVIKDRKYMQLCVRLYTSYLYSSYTENDTGIITVAMFFSKDTAKKHILATILNISDKPEVFVIN